MLPQLATTLVPIDTVKRGRQPCDRAQLGDTSLGIKAGTFSGVLASLGLSACALGPNFHAPAAPDVTRFTPAPLPNRTAATNVSGGTAQQFVDGLDVSGRWWTLYNSTALDALVDRALHNNPDLQAADAALRVARETFYAQRGILAPTVGADYNGSRQKVAAVLAPPVSSNAELFTLHTAQLSISYTPDVFGGLGRQVESAKAQAEAQRFQTEATYSTLISNLVVAAIQEALVRDQIATTKSVIKTNTAMLDVMRRQFSFGEISRNDVTIQEAALAQVEQTLPPLEKQRGQARDMIAALTGRYPGESDEVQIQLSGLELPSQLPLSVPSKFVEQRPDIRAAEALLHVASAQIGVAISNRLPNISLTASAGGSASELSQLFNHGNSAWALGGDVVQPIFQGRALLHKQRAAEAAYAQAQAQYRSSVLTAFQNVADALQAIETDARALTSAAASERHAEVSRGSARKKFEQGEVNSLVVLNADQAVAQAQLMRLQSQAARYTDTAALFQALGGGWWNRSETLPTKD